MIKERLLAFISGLQLVAIYLNITITISNHEKHSYLVTQPHYTHQSQNYKKYIKTQHNKLMAQSINFNNFIKIFLIYTGMIF
jgi:uncharacterized membrane protein SpoIIM required for sporulation